jgi:hypothetical protein
MRWDLVVLYFMAMVGAVFLFAVLFRVIFDRRIEEVKEKEDEEWYRIDS